MRWLVEYVDYPLRVGVYIEARDRFEASDAFWRRARYMRTKVDPRDLRFTQEPR